MVLSTFSISQHSVDFKTLFSVAFHSSSASKVGSSNSFGLPPNTASLSNSDASGTLAGKALTNSCNVLMKLLEIGPETGWDVKEMVLPCRLVVEAVELTSGSDCKESL